MYKMPSVARMFTSFLYRTIRNYYVHAYLSSTLLCMPEEGLNHVGFADKLPDTSQS